MKDSLEKYIKLKVDNPSDKEIQEILDIFELRHFNKKEFIKRPFTISKEIGFLVKGNVRAVFYKKDGEKATFRILQENNFVGDIISIKMQEATPIAFESMNKVTILITSIEKMHDLLKGNLALNIVMREHIANTAMELGRRHLLFLTGNAKERYQFILEQNPNLFKEFPLHLIASLIGITPTQLSRIRNKNSD